ncbi:hypothetical protein HMPREF1620_04592, partial [Escherichia coli 909945-2]
TKSVSWQHHQHVNSLSFKKQKTAKIRRFFVAGPVRGLSSRLYYRSNASASQRRQYSPVTLFLSSKRELLLFC